MSGGACVTSTFRRGRRDTAARALTRLNRLAVHEIGRTLGLPQCPDATCRMVDARGKVATIDCEDALCPSCRHQAAARGIPLHDPPRA